MSFNPKLTTPPTDPLRPINPGNAWGLCITAAAGTELATSYSSVTVCLAASSQRKELYTPKGFFVHVTSLRQAFAHCGRFSTAASRRSMARIAVPFLGVALSRPLPVIALVSLYLANKLIGRRPFPKRLAPLPFSLAASGAMENYPVFRRAVLHFGVCIYVLLSRSPVSFGLRLRTPWLACRYPRYQRSPWARIKLSNKTVWFTTLALNKSKAIRINY